MRRDSSAFNILVLIAYLILLAIVILVVGGVIGRKLALIEAGNVHIILRLLGTRNILLGDTIILPEDKLAFQITWQCSGMFSISLYTLAFLTFPRIRRRVKEWVYGVSILYLVNLARIVGAIEIYRGLGEGAFNIFHYTIGPIILFTVVVLLLSHLLLKGLRAQQDSRQESEEATAGERSRV